MNDDERRDHHTHHRHSTINTALRVGDRVLADNRNSALPALPMLFPEIFEGRCLTRMEIAYYSITQSDPRGALVFFLRGKSQIFFFLERGEKDGMRMNVQQ